MHWQLLQAGRQLIERGATLGGSGPKGVVTYPQQKRQGPSEAEQTVAPTHRQQGQQALSKATVHPAQDEGDADQEPDDKLEGPGPPEPPEHLQRSAHRVNEGSQLDCSSGWTQIWFAWAQQMRSDRLSKC